MTELQLYKWVHVNSVECHYNHDFTELWACPTMEEVKEFFKITKASFYDDGGISCHLMNGYLALDLIPIAEYYGIEIENILPKTEENK
jgi:hypothetical protein